ncbi:MAG: hypothetical protein IK062_02845 [Selenomonadaceae bacterium]|nr:hypothetical protein [Selenomonadaceae bacterium]
MVERIEKVARVKGVDYDVGRRFDSRRNDGGGGDFASELNKVMNKKKSEPSSEIPDAYRLELNSIGSQSLFYYGGLNLHDLLN